MDTGKCTAEEETTNRATARAADAHQPSLSAILHDARVAAGLNIRQASAASGLSTGFISMLEQGKVRDISLQRLGRLATAYGLEPLDVIEAASYAPPADLPPFLTYLRTHYRHMPSQAQHELVTAFERIAEKYDLTLHHTGPAPGQDETTDSTPRRPT
ncbi:hypothetical protein CHIBA101_0075 [Actinomyces sp. Chiba101]|uniref:helix-turn-helix domain-containing protein n=1 Tax=Actinomyces TaxID=1654 RepID=UPI000974F4C2|nr:MULTISPECIES: helix-turn-helix transcriptional regulator [Actinomyces]BAW91952.1 hypothetical protein CHIBA101_0075 [Actinomyces sp. Chiba101]GAV95120.1 hypothetical protein ADENT20671_1900 [Actinomyces denticolens]SUU12402.1 anaerobic benzoate catabolism transcriptional regulator [Actinomyces denticolens]